MVTLRRMWKSSCHYLGLLLWLAAPFAVSDTAVGDIATEDPRTLVYGMWASKGSVFSIEEVDGRLQAHVVALKKQNRLDKKNPEAELRARPVRGLQLLSDYKFSRGAWRGRIYDPASGKTFKSHMKRDAAGNLRVRGFIGIQWFGKTQIFEPVSVCSERIVSMLTSADLGHLC